VSNVNIFFYQQLGEAKAAVVALHLYSSARGFCGDVAPQPPLKNQVNKKQDSYLLSFELVFVANTVFYSTRARRVLLRFTEVAFGYFKPTQPHYRPWY
jgi:hypothetical protein